MTSYKPIKLLDTAISTGTIPSDTHIGFARVRCIDEQSSTLNNLYLFDIKMFTKLSFDSSPGVSSNNFRVGDKVTGSVHQVQQVLLHIKIHLLIYYIYMM